MAYKQPATRTDIEEIRGVEVAGVLETLMERKLVKIVGRKESLGRPLLYGTTMEFMRQFGLKTLEELPKLEELIPPETVTPAVETPAETGALPGESSLASVPAEETATPETPPATPDPAASSNPPSEETPSS